MKILLLSDTHSYIDDAILQHAQWADEVWHAGDFGSITVAEKLQNIKPLRGVYGNIDGTEIRSLFPEKQLFECEGMQVLMTHIGGYPSHYQKGIPELLEREKPQLFICGHSHILKVIYDKKYQLLHLNPSRKYFPNGNYRIPFIEIREATQKVTSFIFL